MNTTGSENTAIGNAADGLYNGAMYNNTTGSGNTAVGTRALLSNSTGSYNIAIGAQAGYGNTTAAGNVSLGYQAGYSNGVGNYNVFIGYQAGYYTTGSPNGRNVFVGELAGYSNTSGRWNTYIGHYAGQATTTGVANTILGRYDGNMGGLDIRTANNNIVLADGDGNVGVRSFKDLDYTTATSMTTIAQRALGLGGPSTASASSMMVGGQDNDRNTAVRYSVPYSGNKWDCGCIYIQIASGKGDATLQSAAWFFYKFAIYLGSLSVSLVDSGGDTGSFTITISDDGDSANYASTMILGILGQSTTAAADNTTMFCNLTWYNGSYEAWRYA